MRTYQVTFLASLPIRQSRPLNSLFGNLATNGRVSRKFRFAIETRNKENEESWISRPNVPGSAKNCSYFFPLMIFSIAAQCCFWTASFSFWCLFFRDSNSFCCFLSTFWYPFSCRNNSTVMGLNFISSEKKKRACKYVCSTWIVRIVYLAV